MVISAQTGNWFLKTGYTGNENRKLEFGFIFLYFSYIQSLTIRTLPYHGQFCSIITLGPTGSARIVRGKLFRTVTVKCCICKTWAVLSQYLRSKVPNFYKQQNIINYKTSYKTFLIHICSLQYAALIIHITNAHISTRIT